MAGANERTIDRRNALKCLGWAGTGAVYCLAGGVATSVSLDAALARDATRAKVKPFTFVQVSDSHIGFEKAANPNVRGTFAEAIAKVAALPDKPAFILHTGDISHLSKESEFAEAESLIRAAGLPVFYVPGEHDTLDEGKGKLYLDRFGKGTLGSGWQSFDHNGIHFIGLVNVVNLGGGGLGHLGDEQLDWLKKDLARQSSSTPIVVFSHMPLWTVYADWGWGTDDSAQALAMLRRFGAVTILNGHIHQVLQKTEGNLTFHSARSTAYPQPAPGSAPAPGPLTVPADQLHSVLGIRTATVRANAGPIVLIDTSLA
jgi:3',5'-cyclic-AMP phosphodiesterase